jgi:PAS domain S-box-containing protein
METKLFEDRKNKAKPSTEPSVDGKGYSPTNMAQMRKENDEYVHTVFMQAPVAITILKGRDYMVEFANDFFLLIVGKEKDFIGKPVFESLPELESQGIRQLLDNVMQSGDPYFGNEAEVHLFRNNKTEKGFFNFVYHPVREQDETVTGIIVVATEVTEQVIARKKVEESEHRYQQMIYTSPSLIAIFKGENMIIEIANDAIIESWGKGKDIIGQSVFSVIPETIEQGFDKLLLSVYKTGMPVQAYEAPIHLVRHGKSELMHYTFVYQAQRNVNGEIEGVAVIANEVTPQALINKKIKNSEERFRNLVEQAIDPICILKGDDLIVELANEPVFKVWNVGKEVLGKPFLEIIPEMKDQPFVDLLLDVLRNGVTHKAIEQPAFFLRKNGEKQIRYFNFVYQPFRENDGIISGVIVFATDVSEQVIAKNKNLESQQMRAIELEEKVQQRTLELSKANAALQEKNQQIALSKYNKRFLTEFSEKFSAHKHYNEFFNSLVQFIADTTNLDYVFVGKLDQNEENEFAIQTIALSAFGKLTENISYLLPDGPCEQVIQGTLYSYPKECRRIFPKNKTIEKFNVEGYIGYPLYDEKGNAVGLIAVMHQEEIDDPETVSSVLKIVARRAEMELEKIKNEEILEENNLALEKQNLELEKLNKELQQKNGELFITKEKLLSDYSRSLIEASLDPLITISPQGMITDMNGALATITGHTREQLIGTDFGIYFTDPPKAREIYKEVFAKGFVTNYPLTIIDSELTNVLFNGSVYKDEKGKVLGAVVVARDITEQKRIEKELTEARVFAEEAKSEAEKATKIAEVAVKSKQQFLSNMSHEIRTPMNAIIGFSKVALKTDLSAKQKEYLTAIKVSGDSLIVLINDILDLAKVDAGKMTFEQTPFKLASSISAMLHLFETKIQEKNLVLRKEYDNRIPGVLVGDPVRLHQIILNLVSNAVKFTNRGKITVSVCLLDQDDEKVTIEFAVTDTGIGIQEDKMQNIFENFQQASGDTARLYGGTGLGLAIVKQLVEAQGGAIRAKSKVDEGSAFTFTLPFRKTTANAEPDIEIRESDMENKNIKVLVVEDMPLNQLLMKTLLDDFGFERDIAANGKIAIEKLATKSYDIILMDLQMPEMNGFEATKYIRGKMKSKIPIIALTADVTTVDLKKCKAVGIDDYIAKPVDEKVLYTKIVGLVKKPMPVTAAIKIDEEAGAGKGETKVMKCIDLAYLKQHTKSNPALMMEMIAIYLEQTPPLISAMKQSLQDKDWNSLQAAVHKMIPSFSIVGISPDFETMARKVLEYANTQLLADDINDMVLQLKSVCVQACKELTEEFNLIKNAINA